MSDVAPDSNGNGRRALPDALKREVLLEAGYRCAIPTCRDQHPHVHHIVPLSKRGTDSFENLIALCANCHGMVHREQISLQAIRSCKANLAILNARYLDVERRVLEHFARTHAISVELPQGFAILLSNLVRDGYLTGPRASRTPSRAARTHPGDCRNAPQLYRYLKYIGVAVREEYDLTPEGRAFLERWETPDVLE